MATLSYEQKIFTVRALAIFNTPTETVKLVKDEFDLDVTKQQVEAYDPTKRAGKDLSQELKDEFETTRSEFLEKPKNIPIANQAVRLKAYQELFEKNKKNPVMAMKILEQSAKELGGQYTNKQEITGKDGNPMQTQTTIVQASPEQINEVLNKAQSEY